MSQYIIERTSHYSDEGAPVEEAYLFKGSMVVGCTCKSFEEVRSMPHVAQWFFRDGTKNHRVTEHGLEMEKDEEFWVVDAPSIESLYERYGRIVVSASDCKEIPICVEVYDDWRE